MTEIALTAGTVFRACYLAVLAAWFVRELCRAVNRFFLEGGVE